MKLFSRKPDKIEMLAMVSIARLFLETEPASKAVMQMHDIITRIETSFADGKEPSQEEMTSYFDEMVPTLEALSCPKAAKIAKS